jgi:predicted TPR repeat methyltransferase
MQTGDTIIQDKRSAVEYDQRARETHWFGPEVIFGLAYEYVAPGDTLLDLGIGSGLSSAPFHTAGLQVYGLDGSSEVLEVCRLKGFAAELRQHDLRDLPLPYSASSFDHVICVAVLNSFRDLRPLFGEIARIMKAQGIFAFTVEAQQPDQADSYAINRVEVSEKPEAETAVTLFRHRDDYVASLLAGNGFVLLKTLEFLAFKYPADNRDIFFKAYVAQKKESCCAT